MRKQLSFKTQENQRFSVPQKALLLRKETWERRMRKQLSFKNKETWERKMKKRIFVRILVGFLFFILLLIIVLFLIRFFSEKQIDDVSPEIPCEPSLLKKVDVLYVIPKFNDKSIAENKSWCEQIKGLDKKLAMHGVYHTYNEFLEDRNEEYLNEGITIFEQCFGFYPEKFKPPQLEISKNNKKLIKQKMNLDALFNQIFHKVYHCNDSGGASNNLVDWF